MPRHDYTQGGAYFVTLCTEGRALLLGDVLDGTMYASDVGRMVETTWHETVSRCASIASEAFQLMPNHVHALVVIAGGADSTPSTSLADFVGRFKSMSTRLYGEQLRADPRAAPRLWQRNYYEHLVRNDRSRDRILRYIAANPSRWPFDRENPRAVRATDP